MTVLTKPALVVNDRTLGWAARFARTHGQDFEWKSARVGIASPSLLHKALSLRFDGLCVKTDPNVVVGCFDHVELAAAGGLEDFVHPKITDLGPIVIHGGSVAITLPPPGKAQKPRGSAAEAFFPAFLTDARIHPVAVDLKSWRFEGFDGSITLKSGETEGGTRIDVAAKALAPSVKAGRDRLEATTTLERKGDLKLEDFAAMRGWLLKLSAQDQRPDGTHAEVHGSAKPVADSLQINLAGDYAEPAHGPELHAKLQGDAREDGLRVRVDAVAARLHRDVPSIRIENCAISIVAGARKHIESEQGSGGHLGLDCPIAASTLSDAIPSGLHPHLPEEARAKLRAELDTAAFPPSPAKKVDGTLDFQLEPIRMPLFEANGGLSSTVSGVPLEFPRNFKHETSVGLRVLIRKFANIVSELERTKWAVWAPLHALDGSLELRAEGKLDTEHGSLPFGIASRLASPSQRVNLDAKGQLVLSDLTKATPRIHATADLALSDVQLELPRLSLKVPPRLYADSRITTEKEAAGAIPPVFTYDVTIHTPDQNPVRILTNLAGSAIPVRLDLRMTTDLPPMGTVEVRNFPVEFFRREATVDHFNFNLTNPETDSKVDGSVRVKYSDYTVTVLVVGTILKPQVQLLSDPPLSQDEIVSVLLYGRTMDELDNDQSSSVGNTQAAVADRALGLLSLYALAATPIQSVGYDPGSGQVLVKVRLAEGTSLNLGSQPGGGAQDIGVRRNLSQHWAITTDLNTPTAATSNRSVVSAFIEWSARY